MLFNSVLFLFCQNKWYTRKRFWWSTLFIIFFAILIGPYFNFTLTVGLYTLFALIWIFIGAANNFDN